MGARVRSFTFLLLHVLALYGVAAPAGAQTQSYRRWLLAEGASNTFFDEEILIGNPNPTAANVTITLLPETFPNEPNPPQPVPVQIVVPALSRYTFRVNAIAQLRRGAVSAVVECTNDLDLVVERSMTWAFDQRRGAHNSQGVLAPAATWYLAEGVTGFFETFILITNTSSTQPAAVEVRFLLESGAPVTATYTLPANGRKTVYVNQDFAQIGAPFSTVVRQTDGGGRADLVVERAMYWNDFEGGHGSAGVTAPGETWLFAEGTTGGSAAFDFQTYLLLANPGSQPTDVTITFFRDSGGPVTHTLSGATALQPNSRRTLFLDELVFANGVRELASASFAIRVQSAAPILAERAVYWSSGGVVFVEGHNTPGVTAEASKWAFAEGREGRFGEANLPSYDTYFLFSNAGAQALRVKGTFLREDGTGLVHTFTVNPASRYTLLTGQFPELSNQRFAAFFEAVDGAGAPVTQPFVAERAVYWGAGYFGGHAATGTPWTGAIGAPPAPAAPALTSVTPANGPLAGGTDVTLRGRNFVENPVVRFGTRNAIVTVLDAETIVATVPAGAAAGAVEVCVDNSATSRACLPGAFTYDAPPPTDPVTTTDVSLAFGDSITYGVTCFLSPFTSTVECSYRVTQPYPERLRTLLAARYVTQTITVSNSGVPGECASGPNCSSVPTSGRSRLPGTLTPSQDLVIFLQGVNDLNAGFSPSEVRDSLRAMANAARAQGKQVVLCSLTPVVPDIVSGTPRAEPGLIATLNSLIAQLAADENLPRVDLVAAFGSNPAQYLSVDGLHPNEAGYQRMAEAIRDRIVERFESR